VAVAQKAGSVARGKQPPYRTTNIKSKANVRGEANTQMEGGRSIDARRLKELVLKNGDKGGNAANLVSVQEAGDGSPRPIVGQGKETKLKAWMKEGKRRKGQAHPAHRGWTTFQAGRLSETELKDGTKSGKERKGSATRPDVMSGQIVKRRESGKQQRAKKYGKFGVVSGGCYGGNHTEEGLER